MENDGLAIGLSLLCAAMFIILLYKLLFSSPDEDNSTWIG